MKIVYVAGPFRAATQWEIAENIRAAERVGFTIAQAGAMPLIPHANTAHFHGTQTDSFWLEGTLELMRRCDAVVMVPGWERSEGAKGEKAEAERLGLPVVECPRLVGSESVGLLHLRLSDAGLQIAGPDDPVFS